VAQKSIPQAKAKEVDEKGIAPDISFFDEFVNTQNFEVCTTGGIVHGPLWRTILNDRLDSAA